MWFAFHAPILFIPGSVAGSQTVDTTLPFLIGILALCVVITWIFTSTRGSLLLIMVLHGAYNTWPDLFAKIDGAPALGWLGVAISVLLAPAIVVSFGPARLAAMPVTDPPAERDSARPQISELPLAGCHRHTPRPPSQLAVLAIPLVHLQRDARCSQCRLEITYGC